ncbi:hypothetical protein BJX68DRAFT_273025 [Aspergillus pseudodeflectus]|uniref:Uncharacterized protein n=1 Tax=Aspergillus pseudodeflectus TaxID=176178 RepID=A0ABR4JC47_9EURO
MRRIPRSERGFDIHTKFTRNSNETITIESMHPELSAPSSQRTPFKGAAPLRPVRLGRWSVPLLATIAIGYGVTSYISKTHDTSQVAEAERLRKNQQLMDAYGYKDNVDDLQKALEAYEVQ